MGGKKAEGPSAGQSPDKPKRSFDVWFFLCSCFFWLAVLITAIIYGGLVGAIAVGAVFSVWLGVQGKSLKKQSPEAKPPATEEIEPENNS